MATPRVFWADDQTVLEADDYFHPVSDSPHWSETHYFTYYDRQNEVGGFSSWRYRAGYGYKEIIHVIMLGAGRRMIHFYEKLPYAFKNTQEVIIGASEARRVEPFKKWILLFRGEVDDVEDNRQMVLPRKLRPSGWSKRRVASLDLDITGMAPPVYTWRKSDSENRKVTDGKMGGTNIFGNPGDEFGHFDQMTSAKGTIRVGDGTWEIDALGSRDKSWGPRRGADYVEAGGPSGSGFGEGEGWRCFCVDLRCAFSDDFQMLIVPMQSDGGGMLMFGHVTVGGKHFKVRDFRIETTFEGDTFYPKEFRFEAVFEGGNVLRGVGEIINIAVNKMPFESHVELNLESMVRYRLDSGEASLGSAEYWINLPKR